VKIRMTKTAAGPSGVLAAGKEYDVELELGQQFVMADAAEWLEAPPKAKPVEVAESRPEAEKAEAPPKRRRRTRKQAD